MSGNALLFAGGIRNIKPISSSNSKYHFFGKRPSLSLNRSILVSRAPGRFEAQSYGLSPVVLLGMAGLWRFDDGEAGVKCGDKYRLASCRVPARRYNRHNMACRALGPWALRRAAAKLMMAW